MYLFLPSHLATSSPLATTSPPGTLSFAVLRQRSSVTFKVFSQALGGAEPHNEAKQSYDAWREAGVEVGWGEVRFWGFGIWFWGLVWDLVLGFGLGVWFGIWFWDLVLEFGLGFGFGIWSWFWVWSSLVWFGLGLVGCLFFGEESLFWLVFWGCLGSWKVSLGF